MHTGATDACAEEGMRRSRIVKHKSAWLKGTTGERETVGKNSRAVLLAMAHQHHHDPTFYRSPADAAAGPPEKLAYVAAFSRQADRPDAIAVVDTDPGLRRVRYRDWIHRTFQPGRRTAPLRLERLLERSLPDRIAHPR